MSEETEYVMIEYAPGYTFVNVYEVFREYGGPEEGGWYYNAGTLMKCCQVAESDAETTVARLTAEWPKTANCWSVVYRGGDYRIRVEDAPGADYPLVTPHYE